MDTKILIIVIAVLVGFFAYKKCSEEKAPDYDEIQNREFSKKQAAYEEKRTEDAEKQRVKAQEEAEKHRGPRPEERFAVLETADLKANFTTRGGSLYSYRLKNPQYLGPPKDPKTGEPMKDSEELVHIDLVTTNLESGREELAGLRFNVYEGLDHLLKKSDYRIVEASDDKVVFQLDQPGLPVNIYKKFEVDKKSPFQIWLTVRIDNVSAEEVAFRAGISQHGYQSEEEASSGGMFSQQPNQLRGLCRYGDNLFSEPWNEDDFGENGVFLGTVGDISFAGIHTNYFLSAMIPSGDTATECRVERLFGHYQDGKTGQELEWGEVVASIRYKDQIKIKPGGQKILRVKSYMGPKKFRLLQSVGYHLETSVDYGMLSPICQVLLAILLFFQSYVVNWGIAIILLTVVVKVVLMPLTHKSFQSSERMKALKPEIDKINEKYKDDPQAKQRETMALYKSRKVNPVGGCIPSLLQMPIWIALFSTLRASPELYRAPFFGWIKDLSSPDPYFVTPILMGGMMFLQQRFTPMTGDSAQAKLMMYFMPIMFTAMMLFLPSGLTLYILVNTVLSIGHQMWIHKRSGQMAMGQTGRGTRRRSLKDKKK
jgi:YidC/Oxa1 family membrane protein insertase